MISRRSFFKLTGATLATATAGSAKAEAPGSAKGMGCLVDLSLCTGCRKCEAACNQANQLPPPEKPFEDLSVLAERRRPSASAFTVVNTLPVAGREPVHVKTQCMHCLDPACASACLVGALRRQESGAITYNPRLCLGCRYCMVACPFQIPAYEYREALGPRVRKCNFCFETTRRGEAPACAQSCPQEAILFGPRDELLKLGHERLATPGRRGTYVQRIFGEGEVGGTAWMYLSVVPFEALDFPAVPAEAPPRLTEAIQHGVFRYFLPPLFLFGFLGLSARLIRDGAEERP